MQLIEKIEIRNFRSFLGTKQNNKAEILEIKDLNIFSGSNDSGKSNILRALNLFFNNEIDSMYGFNFETDFTKIRKDIVQKVIEIKVYFSVSTRKFSISKFYNRYGYRNTEYRYFEKGTEIIIDSRPEENVRRYGPENAPKNKTILDKEKGLRTYPVQFISSISYSYVPAIRDERFFSHLYGKVILQIKQNEEKELEELETLKRKIENYKKTINNKSESIQFKKNLRNKTWRTSELKRIASELSLKANLKQAISELEKQINNFTGTLFESAKFLNSEFRVGNNLKDFFESFDIGTGELKDISLRLRGDGVQAKFIPEMLNFLDSIQQSKKYFIWGFEEPENSAEYKNQQLLAEKFKNEFSVNKQIFLTTHSEEFLSLYDELDVERSKRKANLYHVKKIQNKNFKDFSVINLYDVEKQSFDFATVKSDLEQEIGSSLVRAKYSKELKEKEDVFLKEKQELEKEIINSKKEFKEQLDKLSNPFPPKIFICEDEDAKEVWESFFRKWSINHVQVFSSDGCTDNKIEIWISGNKSLNENYNPKVFRSLDMDGYTLEQIEYLEDKIYSWNKSLGENYKLKFLPVNEFENFAVLSDDFFTIELINANKINLENHFLQTADEKIRQNNKWNSKLFNTQRISQISNMMRREAEVDLKKYFPGKEIKKIKPNFNEIDYLKNLDTEAYPIELKEYLNDIKSFFN